MDFKKEAEKPLVTDEDRVEVIMLVVDNDRDVASACMSAILQHVKYPFKLSIYENSLNSLNTAKIWNKLIRESTCGYICLIDSDAIPHNDFVSLMVDSLKRHPTAAAVAPGCDMSSDVNKYQKGVYNATLDEYVAPGAISGFCFMFKKSIMEEHGYFCEDFLFYGQDSEWTWRMSSKSKECYIVPKAYVNHKGQVSSTRLETATSAFRMEDSELASELLQHMRGDLPVIPMTPRREIYIQETARPLLTDDERVQIMMLVVENDRDIAINCASQILKYTTYPFKLTIYENSLNSMNTSKIWNKLIRESTCGYLCFIDSDADPKNDFVTELVDVFKRHPDAAGVAPSGDSSSIVNHYQQVYNPDRNEIMMYDNMSGFCFMFKKSIMDEYGYFCEDFLFYGQDTEWGLRMSLIPKPFYVVPKAYVNHGLSISSFRTMKTNKEFDREQDFHYCFSLLSKYRTIDFKNYNPWKKQLPYNI